MNRRDLLSMIGKTAGSTVMYQAMTALGVAAESPYRSEQSLRGDPRGTSVLIIGAGLAGMTAALELRAAGYRVTVLEYRDRAGGRTWSLRGGDTYKELGGAVQTCAFDSGLYFNPGPWRIPHHHHAILSYCRKLGVGLEPFVQVNHNAYLHSTSAFAGVPQRYRYVASDFYGGVAELLAKAASEGALASEITRSDAEALVDALRSWGALDARNRYIVGDVSSSRRGWARPPGGGLAKRAERSTPLDFEELLRSGLWQSLGLSLNRDFQSVVLQPKGGMDSIAKAFARELEGVIRFNVRVHAIDQTPSGVVVTHEDTRQSGALTTTHAEWCLCTVPLSVLSQLRLDVSSDMLQAISSVAYASAVKVGLQFKRRFWEEDEEIYGGVSVTDLPIAQIGYPSDQLGSRGKGIVLGAYTYGAPASRFTGLPPSERVRQAVQFGARIHSQYPAEFEHGVAVGWHRVPWSLGCFAAWTDAARREHYDDLCQIDGRVLLAGEHASRLPGWQEGAIVSALDAIARLHERVVGGASASAGRP